MNKLWLNKNKNKDCILFFNGWGLDESAVKKLSFGSFDVCMFSNYVDLNLLNNEFNEYENLYLVAWSLGVWASSKVVSNLKFKKAVAINGTQYPIHNSLGINPEVFQSTLDGWDIRNRKKFNMRIFGGLRQYVELESRLGIRDIENQKIELEEIMKGVESNEQAEINFDTVVIGEKDMIFTKDNQLNYWANKSKLVEMDIPHYPFEAFNSWNQIIEL